MRRDIWQLHPVDVIVSADHMIETMLPVHCHKWHSIIIVKQESAISVYRFLHFWCIFVLDDCLKHLCHILCDWQYSLVPASVFVVSMIYRISDVLCNWWSIFTVLFSRSMSFSVKPQNSDIRIPV